MNSTKIAAVVVTFNRKRLLGECIEALQSQTRRLDAIIVVDNASTDGTDLLFLNQQWASSAPLYYIRLNQNKGGAEGFSEGLRRAHELGFEFVWLMDDDTEPREDALAHLLDAQQNINDSNFGFICSRVDWQDDRVHVMNIPNIKPLVNGRPFNQFELCGVLSVESCSFVSVLVSMKSVQRVGLPIGQMFIWGDDVEFFSRLTRAGFNGYYCASSRALHKTDFNVNTDIFGLAEGQLWKLSFGIRNDLYNLRIQKGWGSLLRRVLWRITILNAKILRKKQTSKLKTVRVNTLASLRSLYFFPKIHHL